MKNLVIMLRYIGVACFAISLFIIISNVVINKENEREIEESPFITFLTAGSNLKDCYTFMPPLTNYEKGVYALGGIGLFLIIIGRSKKEAE